MAVLLAVLDNSLLGMLARLECPFGGLCLIVTETSVQFQFWQLRNVSRVVSTFQIWHQNLEVKRSKVSQVTVSVSEVSLYRTCNCLSASQHVVFVSGHNLKLATVNKHGEINGWSY
ncbi:hypothetical protein J6590_005953 [Homalodisca vitripennis]|nr:hypothetical protein J6590_005953 [Homalodisca vitripennis]